MRRSAVGSGVMHLIDPAAYPGPLFMLFSGGLMFGAVFIAAWVVLRETPFGRQVYAVGQDPVAAGKAQHG